MKYFFVLAFVLIFFFTSWLLNRLACGDISRIFIWNKYIYIVLLPISLFMWCFEAIKSTWFDPKNNFYIVIFGINIVYVLMLALVWVLNPKSRIRNQVTTLKYGIVYNETRTKFSSEYSQSRTMMMLVLSLVANPIINIAFVVIFIMDNFIRMN